MMMIGGGNDDNNAPYSPPPTLRLQWTLTGPYRREIGLVVTAFQAWFHIVDKIEESIRDNILAKLPKDKLSELDKRLLLIPAAPVAAMIAVSAPICIGITMLFFPIALPILIVLGVFWGLAAGVVAFVYFSTKQGRCQFRGTLSPVTNTLLSTAALQTLIYNTGPRPTPVNLAKTILPTELWGRLAVSLLIDVLGSSSYLLPMLGEGFDGVWAPIQTVLIMAMYDSTTKHLKYVSALEEILPFTDVLPSATIGWLAEFAPVILAQYTSMNDNSTKKLVVQKNGRQRNAPIISE